jgi:signal peptidase II
VAEQDKQHEGGRRWHWSPFVITAAVVLLDRLTKQYIQSHLTEYNSIPVIPGLFRIVHTENPGAAFGMLADGNPTLRALVLIGVSAAVMLFVAASLFNRQSSLSGLATRLGLGFILGGAIGNLFDRIATGTVTDFLEVYSGTWSFPAFNIADSAITVGSVLLLIDLLRPTRKTAPQQRATHPPTEI